MFNVTKKSLINALFFFLVIFSYYIAKPIRNSLFLEWMGQKELPFVYLLSAAVSLCAALVLHLVLKRISPLKCIPGAIVFFSAGCIVFRLLFLMHQSFGKHISFALYLFISLFAVVTVTLFWAICNGAHTPDEAKKVYHIVGIGGILGGLCGGAVTQLLATTLGTENLLLVSAAILLCTLPLPRLIAAECTTVPAADTMQLDTSLPRNVFRDLVAHPYVRFVAGFVLLSTILGALLDYQFQGIIKHAGLTKDLRTAYFGRIFMSINGGGILIHSILTRPVLHRWGVFGGLLPIPLIAAAGTIALLLSPSLSVVSYLWIVYGACAYSLAQITRETLYVVIPSQLRYAAKLYIDTFIFRLGDALVALLLLASFTVLRLPPVYLFGYLFAGCACWIVLLFLLKKRVHPTN